MYFQWNTVDTYSRLMLSSWQSYAAHRFTPDHKMTTSEISASSFGASYLDAKGRANPEDKVTLNVGLRDRSYTYAW